jgi:hypothetical protein
MVLNKNLQVRVAQVLDTPPLLKYSKEINIQNMNVELVAQMFKNYRSNVLFHLEGRSPRLNLLESAYKVIETGGLTEPS